MEAELFACLDQCGLLQAQIDAIQDEGYLTLSNFSLNRYTNIESFAKKLQALPVERGASSDMHEGLPILVKE